MSVNNSGFSSPLAVVGQTAECLTEIYRDEVNLVVWERKLTEECRTFAEQFSEWAGEFERFVSLDEEGPIDHALPQWALKLPGVEDWMRDVEEIIDMFRCLFEPKAVGLRLHVLRGTICPRFHTDRVPVRLLTTYIGRGTEWLPEYAVVRPDSDSPLPDQSVSDSDIQALPTEAVSILKGESWIGNEGRGLVHRSPSPGTRPRLVVGLDWLS